MRDAATPNLPAPLPPGFFERDVDTVARALLGVHLTVDGVGGTIVETEAYDATDPASHSFAGMTPRNAPMFGPPGRAYVYRSYGLHWCLNLVCWHTQPGSAVLLRAIEPLIGLAMMEQRRGIGDPRLLCSGPGRLAQALGIDARCNGLALDAAPFALSLPAEPPAVVVGQRIGITKATEAPRRFGIAESRYLSRSIRG
ncbi:DNA-3-methyladenine glycosylase [Sphingomonas sp. RB3P16]|uniref:DNA-3-methyladenine glycosylase n=1 Tax=Parasphingomonas frigoris TaxID=3096163 RepID=UPI002FC75C67